MPNRRSTDRVVAIVPVGTLAGAKSRLGEVLDAEERLDLAVRLLRATLAATTGSDRIAETLVVTPDDAVRRVATEVGARPIRQRETGLNRGIDLGREEAVAAGADAVLILPIDLPDVSTDAVEQVLATLDRSHRPLVAIVADRHGRGTNALLLAPPDAIDTCFGGDSRAAHVGAAREAGAELVELDGPLRLDLDTPEDLLLAEPILRAMDVA